MGKASKRSAAVPTIYDIAKAAGVSTGTVSRTLNNVGYIKEETREKIEKVMRDLKYIPNRAARSLKTKRTQIIMLAIPDTDNPFYVDLIQAVQTVAKHNGYSMILYYTEGKKQDEIKALKMLRESFADGMILINFNFTREHLREIERINCPLVLSGICVSQIGGREEDRFDYIGVDTRKGMYEAARHLILQGHTQIGYVGGVRGQEAFVERYEGFCSAQVESGFKQDERMVYWEDYTERSGYQAGEHFLSLTSQPTAICCANDLLAMGVIRALEDHDVRVPEQISVIGMDNIDVGARLKPRLSSVSIAQAEMGRAAAERIFRRLEGESEPSVKIIFEPRLVVRESSVVTRKG